MRTTLLGCCGFWVEDPSVLSSLVVLPVPPGIETAAALPCTASALWPTVLEDQVRGSYLNAAPRLARLKHPGFTRGTAAPPAAA